jgi:hypothetical protein
MLRIFLFGLSNRRKQPERYMQCTLKLVRKIMEKIYCKIKNDEKKRNRNMVCAYDAKIILPQIVVAGGIHAA